MHAHQAPAPMPGVPEGKEIKQVSAILPVGAGDAKSSVGGSSPERKMEEVPVWRFRRWVTLSDVIHQPLHQICGAFPHGKHHAALVTIESDIPFWVLPNMNRQWVNDLDPTSPLVFTRIPGRNHLTLGKPTKAGQIWILRMSILSTNLNLQFVLTDDAVPELHTSYPVLCASRTNPIPMRIFRVQQWRNLVEANIQMRLTPPIPDNMSEAEALHAEDKEPYTPARAMRKDMERYLDITCYGVDYCEKQDQYHAGTITSVYITAIAERMVLSPNHDCRFTMLPQSLEGKAYPLTGDGPDAFEGILHLPQTFNPLMNAQIFGRIEHVEELPSRLFGEGAEAYLMVVSVQRVPFELLILKCNVVNGTDTGKEAKQFIRGQRFWARGWLQCAHGVPQNTAGKEWPRAVGPSSALDSVQAGGSVAGSGTSAAAAAPLLVSDGKNIAQEDEGKPELKAILTGTERYNYGKDLSAWWKPNGDSKKASTSASSGAPGSAASAVPPIDQPLQSASTASLALTPASLSAAQDNGSGLGHPSTESSSGQGPAKRQKRS